MSVFFCIYLDFLTYHEQLLSRHYQHPYTDFVTKASHTMTIVFLFILIVVLQSVLFCINSARALILVSRVALKLYISNITFLPVNAQFVDIRAFTYMLTYMRHICFTKYVSYLFSLTTSRSRNPDDVGDSCSQDTCGHMYGMIPPYQALLLSQRYNCYLHDR